MLNIIKPFLFFCLITLAVSNLSLVYGEDKVPACKVRYMAVKEEILQELERLENLYAQYRWLEQKIRLLTYEDLWQSRHESLDPLSKEMRQEGNEEEDRILKILQELDKESSQASNEIWKGLQEFPEWQRNIDTCCPEQNFETCSNLAFKPFFKLIETGLPIFDSIFERERDYRKKIDVTTAGREGLYPEDALEDKIAHAGYFSRYEIDKRAQRFQDDHDILRFFQESKKILTRDFSGDDCCYACGKTDWEIKSEKLTR